MKKSLKRLVIDSATKYLFVGLYDNNNIINYFYEEGNNDHSVKLMPQIEKLLKEEQWKVDNIDQIVVGIGPGSYTGLRIGVVVAKMFAWNNEIPLFTVSSLALLASNAKNDGLIVPEIDARRGNSFVGLYKKEGNILKFIQPEQHTNLTNYIASFEVPITVVSKGKPNMELLFDTALLKKQENIHSVAPNYLRKTAAEKQLSK